MGGLCGCRRSGSEASLQNTEAPKREEETAMLNSNNNNDGDSLRIGKMEKDDVITYETLNKGNGHKSIHRIKKSKISGVDDTGIEHNTSNKSNEIDNGYDSGDDDDTGNDDRRPILQNNSSNDPIFLSSSSETLVVKNGGFSNTNGEYRWYLHEQKWVFFTESRTHYSISSNVSVSQVYKQLNDLKSSNSSFKWSDDIKRCWIISDMDSSHIYYAAPMEFTDRIPANFGWISVHGSEPIPVLSQNKTHDSQGPEDDEDSLTFSNSSMSSLLGRHPSSRVNNIGTLIEEDATNMQETPRTNDDDDEDEDNESDVSQMSD